MIQVDTREAILQAASKANRFSTVTYIDCTRLTRPNDLYASLPQFLTLNIVHPNTVKEALDSAVHISFSQYTSPSPGEHILVIDSITELPFGSQVLDFVFLELANLAQVTYTSLFFVQQDPTQTPPCLKQPESHLLEVDPKAGPEAVECLVNRIKTKLDNLTVESPLKPTLDKCFSVWFDLAKGP